MFWPGRGSVQRRSNRSPELHHYWPPSGSGGGEGDNPFRIVLLPATDGATFSSFLSGHQDRLAEGPVTVMTTGQDRELTERAGPPFLQARARFMAGTGCSMALSARQRPHPRQPRARRRDPDRPPHHQRPVIVVNANRPHRARAIHQRNSRQPRGGKPSNPHRARALIPGAPRNLGRASSGS
jgi:hypothetical protein